MSRILRLALLLTACAGQGGCVLGRPLPPLLVGARAASGNYDGCPEAPSRWADPHPGSGASPNLTARLARAFPPGSDAGRVSSTLAAQGFEPSGACQTDPSVRFAIYDDPPGHLRGIFETHAVVFWKADAADRILWTRGFVAYTGP